ncbi:MAG: 3-oxoacyl-ACP reductase [Rhizobacter sp.]|nr:3-oxoacyl-ACP reductase [Rhizobacter sp.]
MTTHDKVAIVTGSGTGIGKASAVALFKNGWRVVICGRRTETLDQVIAECGAGPDRMLAVPTDVSQPDSVKNLFEATAKAFGRLDLLFNNAGMGATSPLESLAFERWKSVVDVNLTGAFLCTQQAFLMMKDQTPQGGRIINNGSISAHAPRPGTVAYTATKHAITGLTKAASLDGRRHNIACGQIDIGNALTDMAFRMTQGVPQANGEVMVEPVMDVQHVADSIVHMANLPLDANVQFMTIMATKMPFIGRG